MAAPQPEREKVSSRVRLPRPAIQISVRCPQPHHSRERADAESAQANGTKEFR